MPKSLPNAQSKKPRSKKRSNQSKLPSQGKAESASTDKEITLNSLVQGEIDRIAKGNKLPKSILADFARFVIANHQRDVITPPLPPPSPKPLTLGELKEAVYQYFSVKSTSELKKSGSFQMAIDGMDALNLGLKVSWEALYRKFIGVLPGEENQEGYGCINGISIFDYFKPWQVFGLESQSATLDDIKKAYHSLSKIYHPDNQKTGDAKIFDRLTIMYKSLTAGA